MAQPSGLKGYNFIWIIVAAYGLINILEVTMDELLQPIKRIDDYIRIRNIARWLVLAGINFLQIILCFAILFKSYGYQFDKHITDWITAFYYSIVTITTLGYGDYYPICNTSKLLVIIELIFFFIMLVFKLPIAIASIKVKVIEIEE